MHTLFTVFSYVSTAMTGLIAIIGARPFPFTDIVSLLLVTIYITIRFLLIIVCMKIDKLGPVAGFYLIMFAIFSSIIDELLLFSSFISLAAVKEKSYWKLSGRFKTDAGAWEKVERKQQHTIRFYST